MIFAEMFFGAAVVYQMWGLLGAKCFMLGYLLGQLEFAIMVWLYFKWSKHMRSFFRW